MSPLVVVGNPANRRVGLFLAAARAAGRPEPVVVSWLDVVGGEPLAFPPGALIRVDSPGEDAEVDRRLRGAATPARPGEIVGLAAWHAGLGRALRRVADAAAWVGATLLNEPAEILTMFDKRETHARLEQAGLPVPPALGGPVTGYADLRGRLARERWHRAFVKPAHGSSASGILALRVGADGRVRATTSVERAEGGLFNSLRVRDYDTEAEVADIVDRLAPDGLHVERWFPKASLGGRVLDLRVVVVRGRATHVVVRTSRHPMTNLHLGGARGELDPVRRRLGPEGFAAALGTAERAAACFPGSLMVGVDLMIDSTWRRHAIAEVNAFGDLLPGLLDRHGHGRDTYAEQLAAGRP